MSDKILVAFAGETNGKITLVDWRQPSGQNHKILREEGDHTPIEWSVGDIKFPTRKLSLWERIVRFFTKKSPDDVITDALKVSGCHNLTVFAGIVEGGTEDVLDVNHSKDCKIFIEDAHPRGNFVTTQKGESKNITVHIDRQHGHGTEVDHDYGNNSDQGNGKTTDCALIVKDVNYSPIKVRVLRADAPSLSGGPFKWAFPKPHAWYHRIVIWFLNLVQ